MHYVDDYRYWSNVPRGLQFTNAGVEQSLNPFLVPENPRSQLTFPN
jgi:hypothetical protein